VDRDTLDPEAVRLAETVLKVRCEKCGEVWECEAYSQFERKNKRCLECDTHGHMSLVAALHWHHSNNPDSLLSTPFLNLPLWTSSMYAVWACPAAQGPIHDHPLLLLPD
jgi:hypothetical protein